MWEMMSVQHFRWCTQRNRLLVFLLPIILLVGCRGVSPEEAIVSTVLVGLVWVLYLLLVVIVLVLAVGLVVFVLVTPPLLGLFSRRLLRRSASPRRRWLVVTIGLLNISNVALFAWIWLAFIEDALWPAAPQEVSSSSDPVLVAIFFSALMLINLMVGIYSLAVGLQKPEESP